MATSVSNWVKKNQEELALPSGNTALVKKPEFTEILSSGMMPDNLTRMALEEIDKAKAGPQDRKKKAPEEEAELERKMMAEILADKDALLKMVQSMDKIVEMVVVQPPVRFHLAEALDEDGEVRRDAKGEPILQKIPSYKRDPDLLYTDDIDPDDKEAIFNFAMGVESAVSTFPVGAGESVAHVPDGEGVEVSPL